MKKFIYLFSAMLAGLAFSSVASAQAVNEIGSLNAGGAILTTECTVLSTKTNVTLSTNSLLTYKCSPVYNQVKLMTCNTAGSRSPATVNSPRTQPAPSSFRLVPAPWGNLTIPHAPLRLTLMATRSSSISPAAAISP